MLNVTFKTHLQVPSELGCLQARPAFTKLRYLLWPSARADWLSRLSERCPKLVINPAQRNFDRLAPAALRWPEEADIRMPLDATDAGLVSQLDLRSEQPDDTHAAAKGVCLRAF